MSACKWILLFALVFSASSQTLAQTAKKAKAPIEPARAVLIYDRKTQTARTKININESMPIASITKLMTAYVILESNLPLNEMIPVVSQKLEKSNVLKIGTRVSRSELIRLSLVSSDNLAAKLLAINYPNGYDTFIEKMNQTAKQLGMINTQFVEPTGLLPNTSTAWDLHLLNQALYKHSMFREAAMSKTAEADTMTKKGIWEKIIIRNTNAFAGNYDIRVGKTGYTSPAGWCISMLIVHQGHEFDLIVLGSPTKAIRNNLVDQYLKEYMNFITRNSVIRKIDLIDTDTGFESSP